MIPVNPSASVSWISARRASPLPSPGEDLPYPPLIAAVWMMTTVV
jgi:hypothetical protein